MRRNMRRFSEGNMPTKKATDSSALPKKALRRPTNLSLNEAVTARGHQVLREMGYNLSEAVEKFLELVYEERHRQPRRQPGDHLQLTFFDRKTLPERDKKP